MGQKKVANVQKQMVWLDGRTFLLLVLQFDRSQLPSNAATNISNGLYLIVLSRSTCSIGKTVFLSSFWISNGSPVILSFYDFGLCIMLLNFNFNMYIFF